MSWTEDARPRFDIEVKLIGENSNAFSLIAKTSTAIRRHLIDQDGPRADVTETVELIVRYLMTSTSYDELLHRIDEMVTIT